MSARPARDELYAVLRLSGEDRADAERMLDRLADEAAAAALRGTSRRLRTEVYGRTYDDAGERVARGVLRAADHLDETAYEADPDAKPITNHAYEGEGGPCQAEAYGTPCTAPRIAHRLDEQEQPADPGRLIPLAVPKCPTACPCRPATEEPTP